ncbi:polyamine ABC transporter substrate-binding protein [Pseudaminobacter soli (ex Li et al. 2025)]|uniref:polyamine ABC transporter substrate-binding protein n=1 Tax=Pseudaminobacter soli (ex Li et al. 2025) TaxID=1295366 RepID=UPI003CD034B2
MRVAAAASTLAMLAGTSPLSAQELNALIWCDHADPALLQPFEEANGVKVNVKEFEGTGAGFAIVEQSQPGDWDVMVIDSIDVPRGVEKGLFEPLPEDKLPFADLFPEVKMDGKTVVDGKRYAITEKFGYNTISYNKTKVDPADMETLSSLTGDKYKGRLAIYDYYLPVVGMAALAIGKKTADLTEADLPALKEELLKMKANAKLVGEVTASQTALATGEVDILVGGGEWVTAGLAKENPALDFSIPKEGGVLWSQSLAMFKDSKNKDLALKFIQYVLSPEGQARLATSSCYWGMPSNKKAALNDDEKKTLRFDEQPAFLARAQAYPAPNADLDKKMQDMWTEMLQAQ